MESGTEDDREVQLINPNTKPNTKPNTTMNLINTEKGVAVLGINRLREMLNKAIRGGWGGAMVDVEITNNEEGTFLKVVGTGWVVASMLAGRGGYNTHIEVDDHSYWAFLEESSRFNQ